MKMYARRNSDGVSVNESAVCEDCCRDRIALDDSYSWWRDAEDVNEHEDDHELYPIDNPDGRCNGCGASVDEIAEFPTS